MKPRIMLALTGAAGIALFAATPAAAQSYPAYGYGSPYGNGYAPYGYNQHQREHEDLGDEHADDHDDLRGLHAEAHTEGLSRREHHRLHRYLQRQHAYEHYELQDEHAREHAQDGYYNPY